MILAIGTEKRWRQEYFRKTIGCFFSQCNKRNIHDLNKIMGLFGKAFYCMYFSSGTNYIQHFDKPLFFHYILLYLHKQIYLTLMANTCYCLKNNFYKPCYNFSVKDKIPLVSKLQKVLLYNINTYFFQIRKKNTNLPVTLTEDNFIIDYSFNLFFLTF